ncbi:hypothetical protein HDV63DRAFT_363228 [Trichoderma sp. SZMC 28014]
MAFSLCILAMLNLSSLVGLGQRWAPPRRLAVVSSRASLQLIRVSSWRAFILLPSAGSLLRVPLVFPSRNARRQVGQRKRNLASYLDSWHAEPGSEWHCNISFSLLSLSLFDLFAGALICQPLLLLFLFSQVRV